MPNQPIKTGLSQRTEARESASAAEVDRRQTRRHSFFLAAEAEEMDSKTKLRARTSDLSLGGCYLDSMSPFAPGTRIQLRLTRDNQTFRCRAVVIYSHLNMGMGVAFLEADNESRALLARWVRELEGEELAPAPPAIEPNPNVPETVKTGSALPMRKLVDLLLKKGVITHEEAQNLKR